MSSSSSASSAGAPAPAPAAAAAAAANEMAVVSSEQQGAAGGALPHGMTQIMAMIPRAPAFGVDDPSWTKALTTCYNANNMTMALMAANTQQLIQQVAIGGAHQLRKTEEKLSTEIHETRHALGQRINVLEQNLDTNSLENKWKSPENMSVRQLVAWLHFQGLDTECVLGSAPVMHFFFPKTTSSKSKEEPPSESTLMVAISRTALQMIMGYKDLFDPSIATDFRGSLDQRFMALLNGKKVATMKDSIQLAAALPYDFNRSGFKQSFVIPASELVKALKLELATSVTCTVTARPKIKPIKTKLNSKGAHSFIEGPEEFLKKKKKNKFVRDLNVSDMVETAFKAVDLNAKPDLETVVKQVIAAMSVRRLFGVPASLEYLQQPAYKMGVTMVLRDVYHANVEIKDDTPFQCGPLWESPKVPKAKKHAKPFLELLAARLNTDVSELHAEIKSIVQQLIKQRAAVRIPSRGAAPSRSSSAKKRKASSSDDDDDDEEDEEEEELEEAAAAGAEEEEEEHGAAAGEEEEEEHGAAAGEEEEEEHGAAAGEEEDGAEENAQSRRPATRATQKRPRRKGRK